MSESEARSRVLKMEQVEPNVQQVCERVGSSMSFGEVQPASLRHLCQHRSAEKPQKKRPLQNQNHDPKFTDQQLITKKKLFFFFYVFAV